MFKRGTEVISNLLQMGRDYNKERQDYYGYGKYADVTPEQQKHRREMASRKKARRTMVKRGGVKPGQEVHHVDGDPTNNSSSNLRAVSKSYNRSKNKKG
jgi:hypothetical protein